jgi:sulfide dehydrogenase cytochrome subunit
MAPLSCQENAMKPFIFAGLALSICSIFFSFPAALAQDPGAGRTLAASCFTCHGTNGNSVQGVPPSLAGRNAGELFQTMKDFQAGKRPATIMHQLARGYTDAQLQAIAAYFASVKSAPAPLPSRP